MKIKQEEPNEDRNRLRQLIRDKHKLCQKKPKIILNLKDLQFYEKSDTDGEVLEWKMPLFFVQDIQRLVLYSIVGERMCSYYPRWCKILKNNHLKSLVLITINDFSEFDFKNDRKVAKKMNKLFENESTKSVDSIEFVSPNANNSNFIKEFLSVPINHSEWLKIRDEPEFQVKRNQVVAQYQKFFVSHSKNKKNSQETMNGSSHELDKISRLSLLLNVEQMIREDYPFPFDESLHSIKGYKYSRETYEAVSETSPIYAIDCEMCFNIDSEMEVVWLAVVNEQLECVYETYVKPSKEVANYLTKITGVNAATLKNITTTLDDVHDTLKKILPGDAILCGQSLNNDLHALKMFHPYIIDTSVIFNLSGQRCRKSSLKGLAAQFLGKMIQESTHNPVVDAKASMQLCLLKLRQSLEFGDVILSGCTNIYQEQINLSIDIDLSTPDKISRFIYQTGMNIDQNFYSILKRYSITSVLIDRQSNKIDKTKEIIVESNEHAFKETLGHLNQTKFIWTQFYACDQKSKMKDLMSYLNEIYTKTSDDTFFLVAYTGRKENGLVKVNEELFKGRCFLKHKNEEYNRISDEINKLCEKLDAPKPQEEVLK